MKIINFFKNLFKLKSSENTSDILDVKINDGETKIVDNHLFQCSENPKESIKKYVEDFLIDSGIDLENVYVQDINKNGCCSLYRKTKKMGNTSLFNDINFSNVFDKNKEYLILPELKSNLSDMDYFYTASVWLHEIAHYIFRHNHTFKPNTICEYEACLYSEKILEKMPIFCNSFYYIDKKINKLIINIKEINLEYINFTNKFYVKTYLDKEPTYVKNILISKEIKDYIKD